HYPRTAFSANGRPTIVPVDPAATIGQRAALSAGDIDGVHRMYGLG
ncbi:M12 family metallopeptidase, partial [Actinoplanes rectilineatus]